MAERRKFSATFKRQVVGELLSQSSTLAQLIRRFGLSKAGWHLAIRGRFQFWASVSQKQVPIIHLAIWG